MKIVYCIHSVCNPGGMERVLCNKVSWLVEHNGWDVTVVTTDQHGRPPFYRFPEQVKMCDLGINYSEDNGKNSLLKIAGYLIRRHRHRKLLTELLMKERPDVTVSLYPSESSFIPQIKDGSKKVLELHYNRFFRLQYARKGILGMIDRYRTRQDDAIARSFDRFVVLTEEDRGYWGEMPGMEVIPNAALDTGNGTLSDVSAERVIAVGRLDYQKGFDRLVRAWDIVMKNGRYSGWKLDIFGQGEWKDMLTEMIVKIGLEGSVRLMGTTHDIRKEYLGSSMLVMSSNYEGFPMVMIEAMACGLPVVSFDFKCGPKDIINDGKNGILVMNGDIQGLADAMMRLMKDCDLKKRMSAEARKVVDRYSEDTVMKQWTDLFENLVNDRSDVLTETRAVGKSL